MRPLADEWLVGRCHTRLPTSAEPRVGPAGKRVHCLASPGGTIARRANGHEVGGPITRMAPHR
ncbi:hypothetical protein VO63_02510 [Streptomyces showdoensis]|uniref:Uncharacterized protein n=1 Tax=Streptomyces showdoensis TaxID=68268 RepID=A0A2P2GV34_STREW|nr:hypothetical protein VO63_02510 [Streptomyces showdoensis]